MTTGASLTDRLYTYAFWQLLVKKHGPWIDCRFFIALGGILKHAMKKNENDQNIIPLPSFFVIHSLLFSKHNAAPLPVPGPACSCEYWRFPLQLFCVNLVFAFDLLLFLLSFALFEDGFCEDNDMMIFLSNQPGDFNVGSSGVLTE